MKTEGSATRYQTKFFKLIVIKTMILAQIWTNRAMGDSPATEPYLYSYLIYDRGELAVQWGKDSLRNNQY